MARLSRLALRRVVWPSVGYDCLPTKWLPWDRSQSPTSSWFRSILSSAHRSDTCLTFLRNQLMFSPTFTIDHFRITSFYANLLIQHVFPNEQYPVTQLTNNTWYLLLLRAFEWVYQPHSLASLQKHALEPWIQLFDFVLTRPSLAPIDLVDTSSDACATRLLELHSGNRSILQLYPDLAKDPALVSE